MKKYLTKQNIKKFLINSTLTFLVGFSTFLFLHYLFIGDLPENLSSWIILTLVYSIFDSVNGVIRSTKLEDINLLTIDNYWKLKKELKGKVDRKGGRRNQS